MSVVETIQIKWFPDEPLVPWFRGQGNSEWPLRPKLYRCSASDLDTEDEIREEFCTRAPALGDNVPGHDLLPDVSNWAWYFLMQHYGAPTRLLDWTESALIALYFAVRSNDGTTPAAVWAIDPYELNWNTIRAEEVIPPADPGILPTDRKKVAKWLPTRFKRGQRLPRLPAAVAPTHTARRISAQRSCFTIHGSDRDGLEVLAKRSMRASLMKLEVPAWETRQIRRTLETCGIDETSAFPDLQALGRSVGLQWTASDQPQLPHEGALVRLGQSKIHGVGVFAIQRIPKGTRLFAHDTDAMVWIPQADVERLASGLKSLYGDFAVLRDGRYGAPVHFDRLTPAWYLNSSPRNPNVVADEHANFFAARNIAPGEELTVDYSTYSQNELASPVKRNAGHQERARPTGRTA